MARNNNKINLPTNTTDIKTLATYLKYIDARGVVSKDVEQDVFAEVKINESKKTVTDPARDTHTKSTLKLFGLIDVAEDDSFSVSSLGKEVLNYYFGGITHTEEERVALMLKVLCRWEINDKYGRHMHPGFILMKLLCDSDLNYYITNHELSHFTMSSKFKFDDQYDEIKQCILEFRSQKLAYDEDWKKSKSDIFLSTFDTNWGLLTRTSRTDVLNDRDYRKLLKQWSEYSASNSDASETSDEIKEDLQDEDTSADEKTFVVNECRLNGLAAYVARLYLSLLEGINVRDYLSYFTSSSKNNCTMNATQKIYYGTPGSGKSHKVLDIVGDTKYRTIFHPDADYASFVGSYKPTGDEKEGIGYEFIPQVFTKAYVDAWTNPNKEVNLVIEEINRGNCAQIFGDLFQLLDRKNGFSEYPVTPNTDLQKHLKKIFKFDPEAPFEGRGYNLELEKKVLLGELMILPPNLSIYATMNTSDQSLFPMDSAFKRRWDWEYVPVCYEKATDDGKDNKAASFSIKIDDAYSANWLDFLKGVNEKIKETTYSEDKQMGNYFIKDSVDVVTFINKVMYYLWSEVCKEEYKTDKNFFRYENEDGDIIEFSFNELFPINDKSKAILKSFIERMIAVGNK